MSLEEHPSLEDEGSKNDDQSIDTIEASGYRKVPIPPHPERALIARFRGRPRARPKDMRVVRVLVQGRHVSGATEEEIVSSWLMGGNCFAFLRWAANHRQSLNGDGNANG